MNDRQMEQDEQDIDEREFLGDITPEQANRERRELNRAYRDEAQQSAEQAYTCELENW